MTEWANEQNVGKIKTEQNENDYKNITMQDYLSRL